MNWKANIFWIVIGVIVVASLGTYWILLSSIKSPSQKTTYELETDAQEMGKTVKELLKKADDKASPDQLVTTQHVNLLANYKEKLKVQAEATQKAWKDRKLDLRFEGVPMDSTTKFDTWLSDLRTKLLDQCGKAGLQVPGDIEKTLMFKEPSTSQDSPDKTRHREYRLRQMALVEEVLSTLSRKYARQKIVKYKEGNMEAETVEVDVGASALERLAIYPPRSELSDNSGDSKNIISSEEHLRSWAEDAVRRSGRASPSSLKPNPIPELPYEITSLDVQIVAPLAAIPAIAQALESSTRYTGVVTRMDFQRTLQPFPSPLDTKIAKAEAVPNLNTFFQEGPVRALISLDVYEYSAAKEAALKAKVGAEAAKAAAVKKPKQN